MSYQKIHSFHCLFLLLVVFYAPLRAEVRTGLTGTGWPGGGAAGLGWFRYEECISGQTTESTETSQTAAVTAEIEPDDALLSAVFSHRLFLLHAGSRDLPARSMFYADAEHPPGFLPARRRARLIFLQPLPALSLPGIWSSHRLNGPGFFLHMLDRRLFLVYHPGRRIWGVTLRTAADKRSVSLQEPSSLLLDFEGEKKELQGYGRLNYQGELVQWQADVERRPYWDRFRYREEMYERPSRADSTFLHRDETDDRVRADQSVIVQERRYRSYSLSSETNLSSIVLLFGGMDRGDVAFRLASMRRSVPDQAGWYLLPELSFHQMQIYREDQVIREVRPGLGVARRASGSLFEGIVRVGEAPSVSMELRGSFYPDRLTMVQPALLLSHCLCNDSFEYMGAIGPGEGRSRFLERMRYAFGFRATLSDVRLVLFYGGRYSESGTIREWGYLRLEWQHRF